jgi:hypothetical protein
VVRRVVLRAELARVLVLRAPAVPLFALLAVLRVPLLAALRVLALRVLALRAGAFFFRAAVLLRAVGFFARLADPAELARAPVVPASSSVHFPDITRCAASATASAINAPSLLALDMTLFAACDAESAASSPASRILRRAAGLALIAAAAAASPAPSISRLIAALAILSTVDFPERELDFEERFFVLDFAIAKPPFVRRKTLQPRNSSRRGRASMFQDTKNADK